jgi:hypothetical protein
MVSSVSSVVALDLFLSCSNAFEVWTRSRLERRIKPGLFAAVPFPPITYSSDASGLIASSKAPYPISLWVPMLRMILAT